MKTLEFKCISPFFELTRDGKKPFDIRLVDYNDPRFRTLAQWGHWRQWAIKLTNPVTGESLCKRLIGKCYMPGRDYFSPSIENWIVLYLGDDVESEEGAK